MSKIDLLNEIASLHDALAKCYRALASNDYQSPSVRREPSQNGGQYKEFDASTIIKTFDDEGNVRIKIKGKPYEKFGVPVYEEDFSILGVDVDTLPPGSHQFNHRVRAVLKDDGNPRKIVEVLA